MTSRSSATESSECKYGDACNGPGSQYARQQRDPNAMTCEWPKCMSRIASESEGKTDVPICADHAQTWFTERNHLSGGMNATCIVCAHTELVMNAAPKVPAGSGVLNQPSAAASLLREHVVGPRTLSAGEGKTYYANPQQRPERGEAVNLARNWLDGQGPNSGFHITTKGIRTLAEAVMLMDAWILEVTKPSASSSGAVTDYDPTPRTDRMAVQLPADSGTALIQGLKFTRQLEHELERLREFQRDTEEAEARCCPEDVGFEEWIGILTRRLSSAKAFHKHICEIVGTGHDEKDWHRDLASLVEVVRGRTAPAAQRTDLSNERLCQWADKHNIDGTVTDIRAAVTDALDSFAVSAKEGTAEAKDAARWRFARTIFAIEDVERAVDEMRGFASLEDENLKADAAIDAAIRAAGQ